MAFSLVGSLVAFLIYNFSPAKIFMGDTGSLLIGILNSVFVIKFIAVAADPSLGLPLQAAPAIGFAILIIPLVDTFRVVTMRILSRRSPFSPDRNHIHHFLLDLGWSHKKITLSISAAAVGFIIIAFFCRNLNTTLTIGILLTLGSAITAFVYNLRKKNSGNYFVATTPGKEVIRTHKIISFTPNAVEAD